MEKNKVQLGIIVFVETECIVEGEPYVCFVNGLVRMVDRANEQVEVAYFDYNSMNTVYKTVSFDKIHETATEEIKPKSIMDELIPIMNELHYTYIQIQTLKSKEKTLKKDLKCKVKLIKH